MTSSSNDETEPFCQVNIMFNNDNDKLITKLKPVNPQK